MLTSTCRKREWLRMIATCDSLAARCASMADAFGDEGGVTKHFPTRINATFSGKLRCRSV